MNRSKNPMLTFIRENLLFALMVASSSLTGCVLEKSDGKTAFALKIKS